LNAFGIVQDPVEMLKLSLSLTIPKLMRVHRKKKLLQMKKKQNNGSQIMKMNLSVQEL